MLNKLLKLQPTLKNLTQIQPISQFSKSYLYKTGGAHNNAFNFNEKNSKIMETAPV